MKDFLVNEFLIETVFGGYSLQAMFGYVWFFLIGYAIYGLNETRDRDTNSKNTPKKWSWRFWIGDNWKRYLVTILSTYIMFRFYVEVVGHTFSDFEALMMGMINDGIGDNAKRKVNGVAADRKKLMIKEKENEKDNI